MRLKRSLIPCPICGVPVQNSKFMCLPHWLQVPRKLQLAVSTAWAAVRRAKGPQELLTAIRRHRDAKQAAVEAVMARMPASRATEEA